jgi:hypothetical protein
LCNYRYTRAAGEAKTKITLFSYSNVGARRARDIGAAALFFKRRGNFQQVAAIFPRPAKRGEGAEPR